MIIISMWASTLASTLEHTSQQNNGGVEGETTDRTYSSPKLIITINDPPTNEKISKEINGRTIIGYAITNDYATVRETPNSTGKIVRQLSPGNNIYIVDVEDTWYEIYSKSGNTHGFVIEDVLDLTEMTATLSEATLTPPEQR